MTTTKNNEHKKLNFSNEQEQSQACLNSAEHEKNQGRKVLNVPNLRFPEFQGEWKKCTLNEVCKFHNGRAYKQTELLAAGKYRVLRVGNFFTNDSWYYSNLELEDNKYAQNGDLLYAWSASFGPRFWREEKVIFHYHIWKIDSFKNFDKNFLYHFLDLVSAKIKNEVQGGTMVHITKGDMEKRTISYPSVPEQRNIARFLFLLDERIATQNKIIDKLQSLIKGIAQKIVRNNKPNVRLAECLECKSSTLQESEVCEQGTYPVYGANGIVGYLDNYSTESEAVYIIKDGSGVGTVSYVTGKCSATGTLNTLQAKEGYSLQYLYYLLKVFNFEPYKTGMAIPHIYFKDYGKAKVFCPSYTEQLQYARLLSAIDNKLSIEQNILTELSLQKQYLLHQMFI